MPAEVGEFTGASAKKRRWRPPLIRPPPPATVRLPVTDPTSAAAVTG